MKLLLVWYLSLSLAFYGVAIALAEGFISSILLMGYLLITAKVLCSFKSNMSLAYQPPRSERCAEVTLWLTLCPLLFAYLTIGAPLLSERPEMDRVLFSESLGFYNRLYPAVLNVLAFYYGLVASIRGFKKRGLIILGLLVLIVLLSGFRAKIIDLVFLYFFGLACSNPLTAKSLVELIKRHKTFLMTSAVVTTAAMLLVTQLRTSDPDVLQSLVSRVFVVNHQVNLLRIELYTERFGFALGAGYFQDLYSLVSDKSLSVAMTITQYFGGSTYFTMTPTLYGEAYYNFGNLYFCSVFFVWFARALLDAFFRFMPTIGQSTPVTCAFYAVSVYSLMRSSITLGVAPAFSIKVLPVLILYAAVLCVVAVIFGKVIKVSALKASRHQARGALL